MDKFCYLGDMLSVAGDADEARDDGVAVASAETHESHLHLADAAVEARIRIGCNKFRQLLPLLTSRDISLIRRGRLYSSCV